MCIELFNLFVEDGLKLFERVLIVVIIRMIGKFIVELVDDEIVWNKMKVMEFIFFKSSLKFWELICVLNVLFMIFFKEEDFLKLGWII